MKKKFIIWFIISAAIMLLLPWLAAAFVKSDAGMAACFLLLFGINPIYSVVAGVFSGRAIKTLWALPLISAALFLAGAWFFLDWGETGFLLYAIAYLVLGILSMLISAGGQRR